jgi:hypothetical protein
MAVLLQENTKFPAINIDGYQKMYLQRLTCWCAELPQNWSTEFALKKCMVSTEHGRT